MYRYLIRKNPYILLYLLMAPLSAVSSIACAGAVAAAVDYASSGDLSQIWTYLAFFGAYILLDFAIDTGAELVRYRLAKQTMMALKMDIYHKTSRMCYLHFFQRNTADYISLMTADADMLRTSYFSVLLELYMDFLRCGLAIAVLFGISPILGVFVLANALIQTAIPILCAKKLEKVGENYSNAQEQYMTSLKETLSAFLTAKVFHVEEKLEENYGRALEHAEESRRKMKGFRMLTSNLSFVFATVTHLGVFLLGSILTIQGVISMAEVVASAQIIVFISSPIYQLNMQLADLRTSKASAKKLQALLDEPEDLGWDVQLEQPKSCIRIENLRFRYNDDREILKGINYKFQQGKKYLIVGASGCGKSTLLNLLAGLRGDYTGSIFLGDTELCRLSRASLTASICIINQEPFLFDDTLYHNVCLYENVEREAVLEALRRVELEHFLAALPKGIDTPMGENAGAISGGEKQRVVIARALVRKTPILLLDESTSHLDPSTAAEIERLVLGLEGVTVLLVSHNATQIAKSLADYVLEMRDGTLHPLDPETER